MQGASVRVAVLRSAVSVRHAATRALSTLNCGGVVEVGQRLTMSRTFSQADVQAFAVLSGDYNPIHLDASAARAAGFERPLCHGLLYSSLPGTLLAQALPGVVYVSQTLNFKRPVYVDEPLQVVIEVETVLRRRLVSFATTVLKCGEGGPDAIAMSGTAVAQLPAAASR